MPNEPAIASVSLPRFFVAPRTDIFADLPALGPLSTASDVRPKPRRANKTMRYAGYVRISSEEQVGNFSVDAQRRAIEAWVAAKGGQLVKIYVDERARPAGVIRSRS